MDWARYLSERDRAVMSAAGYGSRGGLGQRVALLVIDVTYAFCGDRPEPVLDSIRRWRNSSGEAAWDAIVPIQRLLEAAHERDVTVIYTRGIGRAAAGMPPGRWSDKNSCVAEDQDDDHEIVVEVAPFPGETVLHKSKPSAFFGPPCESARGPEHRLAHCLRWYHQRMRPCDRCRRVLLQLLYDGRRRRDVRPGRGFALGRSIRHGHEVRQRAVHRGSHLPAAWSRQAAVAVTGTRYS